MAGRTWLATRWQDAGEEPSLSRVARIGVPSAMRARLLGMVLLACDPSPGSPVSPVPAEQDPVALAPAVAAPVVASPVVASPARRCLPVVAAECGCVYTCGLGTEQQPGRWSVAHEFWAPHPVLARVDRWCVAGQCTEAFFGELPCSGICPPKPAEPGCRLVDDHCEVAAKPSR